jgi:ferrous iron transport protein A
MTPPVFETLQKMDRLLLEQFLNLMLQANIALTDQEAMIAKEILKLGHHVRLEEVHAHLGRQFPDLAPSLWIRILELLLKYRIVIKTQLEGVEVLEHHHPDKRHYHMVCMKTGMVEEFRSEVIEEVLADLTKQHSFLPVFVEINIYGVSKTYLEKSSDSSFSLLSALEKQVVEVLDLGNQDEDFLQKISQFGFGKGARLEILGQTRDGREILARWLEHRLIIPRHKAEKILVRALSPEETRLTLEHMNHLIGENPSLNSISDGEKVRVLRIRRESPYHSRLIEMGFLPGCLVTRIKTAPLGDPVQFALRGFFVSLRKEESSDILVERVS